MYQTRMFAPGQHVTIRDYRRGGEDKWVSGKVFEQSGPVSYRVEVDPGVFWRRHVDQMRMHKRIFLYTHP